MSPALAMTVLLWVLVACSALLTASSLAYAVLVISDRRKSALQWCACNRCGLIDADHMDTDDGWRHARQSCSPVAEWIP